MITYIERCLGRVDQRIAVCHYDTQFDYTSPYKHRYIAYSKNSEDTENQMKQSDWPVEPSTHCQFK